MNLKKLQTSDARQETSATGGDDETLDVVRQMMKDATEAAKASAGGHAARPTGEAAPEPDVGATTSARAASLLPELAGDDAVLPPAGGRRAGKLAGKLAGRLAGFLTGSVRRVARRGAGPETAQEVRRTEPNEPAMPAAGPGWLRNRIERFEPSRRVGFVLLFLAVMIWKPWLIPGLLFLGMWIALIVYFTLGPERITELVLVFWDWFSRRRPERAQLWLGKVQRAADRIDGLLARLPERWSEGIYLPDFGRSLVEESSEVREEMERDPYERLSQQSDAATQLHGEGNGAMLRS